MTSNQRLVFIKSSIRAVFVFLAVCSTEHTSSSNTVDEDVREYSVAMGNFRTCDNDNIISSPHQAIADTRVPQPVAEGIWKKAEMLETEDNAVVDMAPGCGLKDKMVK